jgi:hypothetical protein
MANATDATKTAKPYRHPGDDSIFVDRDVHKSGVFNCAFLIREILPPPASLFSIRRAGGELRGPARKPQYKP